MTNHAALTCRRLRYLDGHKRREKGGNRSAAEKVLAKRHTQKLEHRKLPETLWSKAATFRELGDDALLHSQAENSEKQTYELRLRIGQLFPVFGSRPADSIKKNDNCRLARGPGSRTELGSEQPDSLAVTF